MVRKRGDSFFERFPTTGVFLKRNDQSFIAVRVLTYLECLVYYATGVGCQKRHTGASLLVLLPLLLFSLTLFYVYIDRLKTINWFGFFYVRYMVQTVVLMLLVLMVRFMSLMLSLMPALGQIHVIF